MCVWVWVCVGVSRWILFTLEESEMPGSAILKLTGPFGSNHQMCHGKNATSWCKGRQDFASINIFLQDWQWMSFRLGLWTSSLQILFLRVCNMRNNCPPSHMIQSIMWSTNRDNKRGRVLSVSPPPDRKCR